MDLAAAYAIDNELAPILTYTYGSCEQALGTTGNAFYNALWQQAAAEGITVLVASGDNGAAGCDNPNAGASTTWTRSEWRCVNAVQRRGGRDGIRRRHTAVNVLEHCKRNGLFLGIWLHSGNRVE